MIEVTLAVITFDCMLELEDGTWGGVRLETTALHLLNKLSLSCRNSWWFVVS